MAKRRPGPARRSLKPTGLLKDYAATKIVDNVLMGDITAHVLAKASAPSDRRQDILHPSELAKSDWCPRSSWYRLKGTPASDSGRGFSMQMETIFQEGHDIHAKWQTWLAEMGILWGTWYCSMCGHRWEETSPKVCAGCGVPASRLGGTFDYREVVLNAEAEWLIAGHEDGGVVSENALVEIKSVGLGTLRMEEPALVREFTVRTEDGKSVVDYDGLWKSIRRPLGSHIRQTQIYLAIAQLRGLPFDRVVFIYESKATQATKEFVVKYNPDLTADIIDAAKDIKYALKAGATIPRPSGLGPDSKVCKECVFRTECYKEEPIEQESSSRRGRNDTGASIEPRRRDDEDAGISAAPATRRQRAEAAGGTDRPGRRRTNEPVHHPDPVGGVHGGAGSSSGGRRKVRRRGSIPDEGSGGPQVH